MARKMTTFFALVLVAVQLLSLALGTSPLHRCRYVKPDAPCVAFRPSRSSKALPSLFFCYCAIQYIVLHQVVSPVQPWEFGLTPAMAYVDLHCRAIRSWGRVSFQLESLFLVFSSIPSTVRRPDWAYLYMSGHRQ